MINRNIMGLLPNHVPLNEEFQARSEKTNVMKKAENLIPWLYRCRECCYARRRLGGTTRLYSKPASVGGMQLWTKVSKEVFHWRQYRMHFSREALLVLCHSRKNILPTSCISGRPKNQAELNIIFPVIIPCHQQCHCQTAVYALPARHSSSSCTSSHTLESASPRVPSSPKPEAEAGWSTWHWIDPFNSGFLPSAKPLGQHVVFGIREGGYFKKTTVHI